MFYFFSQEEEKKIHKANICLLTFKWLTLKNAFLICYSVRVELFVDVNLKVP